MGDSDLVSVLLVVLALCVGAFLWGVVLLVFRRGKRRRGAFMVLGAFAVFMVAGVFLADAQARADGWLSAADKGAAAALGFVDPVSFAPVRAQIESDKAKALADQAALDAAAVARRDARLAAEAAEREESARRAAAIVEAKEAEAAADKRRRGFHCLSSWDGSHRDFAAFVKKNLREPDSFEHVETRIAPVDAAGFHALFMTYRARNGFGGMNVETARAQVSQADCRFTPLAVE